MPFLDAACERDWSSKLSAVYGHHLINDGMFSPLAAIYSLASAALGIYSAP